MMPAIAGFSGTGQEMIAAIDFCYEPVHNTKTMKTSIATVSLSGTLEGKLRAVADAGFGGVEIFENDLLAFPGSPRDVGRLVRDLGMEVTLFQPFRDLEGMPPEQRGRAFERMERKFDVMSELGTDLVLLCSNCSP